MQIWFHRQALGASHSSLLEAEYLWKCSARRNAYRTRPIRVDRHALLLGMTMAYKKNISLEWVAPRCTSLCSHGYAMDTCWWSTALVANKHWPYALLEQGTASPQLLHSQ